MTSRIITIESVLDNEEVPNGVKLFLGTVDPQSIQLESGEPNAPDYLRVKTSAMKFKEQANSIALLLHPFNTLYSALWLSRHMNLFSAYGIVRLKSKELRKIGMEPDKCHPFPEKMYEEPNTLNQIIVDCIMMKRTESHYFPIYSVKPNAGRIGSLIMTPKDYFSVMCKLFGENLVSSYKVMDEERRLN